MVVHTTRVSEEIMGMNLYLSENDYSVLQTIKDYRGSYNSNPLVKDVVCYSEFSKNTVTKCLQRLELHNFIKSIKTKHNARHIILKEE